MEKKKKLENWVRNFVKQIVACLVLQMPDVDRDRWRCGESYSMFGVASSSCVKSSRMHAHGKVI